MLKKLMFLGVLLVFGILAIGCTKNVYYTSPVESQSIEPREELPLLSPNEERTLIEQYFRAHGVDESDYVYIPTYLDNLNNWNVHPLKMYKGSIIYYGGDYAKYIFYLELETSSSIENIAKINRFYDDKDNIINRNNGNLIKDGLGHDNDIIAFEKLSDIENFITEFREI